MGALLTLGCSSDSLTEGTGASKDGDPTPMPSATATATPTATAPTIEGEFAPIQAYPPGPYGYGIGAVIDNLEFIGWRDPVASAYDVALLEHVRLGDFYDPNGTNTELIVINASAVWCTVCQAEMRDMNRSGTYEAFRARKVQVLGTLFEDGAGDPAKPRDLSLWGSSDKRAIAFPLVLDPALKMGRYFASDATPLNLVVDARTMRIVSAVMGYDATPGTGLWGSVDQELIARGL
jgi:hypothetical protein